jgi:hypothetical protein
LCPDPAACDEAEQANAWSTSGRNFKIGANVAFGVGAAAAIGAGVLWFTGAPDTSHRIAVTPLLGGEATGFVVAGRF